MGAYQYSPSPLKGVRVLPVLGKPALGGWVGGQSVFCFSQMDVSLYGTGELFKNGPRSGPNPPKNNEHVCKTTQIVVPSLLLADVGPTCTNKCSNTYKILLFGKRACP